MILTVGVLIAKLQEYNKDSLVQVADYPSENAEIVRIESLNLDENHDTVIIELEN